MEPVLAYLDPGSGSVILQALLGGVAGLAVALKLFGRRVFTFFRFRKPDPVETRPPEPDSDGG